LFNLLRGRDLQREEGQRGQICFTTPLINGLDGRKMSKSYGNAITFNDVPDEMYGKVMSIEDGVMREWYTLLTDVSEREIDELLAGHPREAKARLAQEITTQFHTREAALKAREAFDRRFRDKEIPEDVPEIAWPAGASGGVQLMALLKDLGLCASTSEAKRLIEGGGVRLDNEVHKDPRAMIQAPQQPLLIQAGKRKFVRVQAPS
jgi:tyrosyl-tRNA synthetase